jgi:hypothetical protein
MGFWKNRALEHEARGFGEADGAICLSHVADAALVSRLRGHVTERTCITCDRSANEAEAAFAVPFETLLLEISAALHRHYANADDEGVPWDSEEGCYMGAQTYEIGEVIDDICEDAFVSDVRDALVEQIVEVFGFDVTWTDARGTHSLDTLDWEWSSFVETVQSKSRFIIVTDDDMDDRMRAPRELASFLGRLGKYVDGNLDLVDDLYPGAVFYRGRLMDSTRALERKCKELQPAPPAKASANRMSPAGIPFFYASADAQTAIAEIAGHGPEPYALVGAFRSTKQLRLLDFTRKPAFPSYFDEDMHAEFGLARFLKWFVRSITQPIIPDGRQHIEYTPTQVLTEYLRWMPKNRIDGIALPSAQTGKKTYVLFFDGEACADNDSGPSDKSAPLMADSPDRAPVFILAKDDICVYEVKREYSGAPINY